jgi:type IV pilus assembly protein PilB
MTRALRARLGEVLIAHDLITMEVLLEALHRQQGEKRPIGQILIEMGALTQDQLYWALSEQLGIPYVELSDEMVDLEAARAFPEDLLRRHQALPILKIRDELTVALADPTNEQAVTDLLGLTRANITVAIASSETIGRLLDQAFPPKERPERARYRELHPPDYEPSGLLPREASGVALAYSILLSAVREKATEIHVEPHEAEVRVRYRVAGRLEERAQFPVEVGASITLRLRVLAGIREKAKWQKSRIRTRIEDQELELEILLLPTRCGDTIRIFLWRRDLAPPDVAGLGLSAQAKKVLDKLIQKGSGCFFVTSEDPAARVGGLYALALAAGSKDKQVFVLERAAAFEVASMVQVETPDGFDEAVIEVLSHPPEVALVEDVTAGPVSRAALTAAGQGALIVGGLPYASVSGAWQHLLALDLPRTLLAESVRAILAVRREGEAWVTELFTARESIRRRLLRDSDPWILPIS